jgi:uncharacterized Zn finger protein
MCKHVAAVLYGIGQRLDHRPELLFTLRQVAHEELIAKAGDGLSAPTAMTGAKVLAEDDLSAMFGIEIATPAGKPARPAKKPVATPARRELAGKLKSASVRIPRSAAAARIRATKPRSPMALKRAIAKQLKDRGEDIRRSRESERKR